MGWKYKSRRERNVGRTPVQYLREPGTLHAGKSCTGDEYPGSAIKEAPLGLGRKGTSGGSEISGLI